MTRSSYSRNPLSENTGAAASNGMMPSSSVGSVDDGEQQVELTDQRWHRHDACAYRTVEHDHLDRFAS